MRRLIRTLLALVGVCAAATAGRADPPTKEDRLKAVKEACAIVEIRDGPRTGMRGSALAVGRGGYFVTAPTFEYSPFKDEKVWVTLRPGEKGEKRFEGRVVRVDLLIGLAVVRVKGVEELPAVTVGDADKVEQLEDLIAFGSPYFEFSKLPVNNEGKKQFPPHALAEQKVSVAAKVLDGDKKPVRFTLDKPGVKGQLSAGGPVVNDKGELVGVVAGEGPNIQPPAAFGAVLTIRALNAFLSAVPTFDIESPEIDPKERFDKAPVKATLLTGLGKPEGYTVELSVRSGGRERKVEMKAAADRFEAGIAPFEKTDEPDLLTAEIAFPDSRPRLPIADAAFKVGGKEFHLSDVTRVRFGKGGGVNTVTGPVDGEVTGLEVLAVRIGEQVFSLKTAAATELTVRLPAEPKHAYRMIAIAKKDGKEVGRAEEIRFLKGMAPSGLDGLRVGYLVKPLAGETPKTFARVLVAGEDEPQDFAAEQMPVAAVAGPVEKGKPSTSGMIIALHPIGWKPLPGDPFRAGNSTPLYRLEFGTPYRKPFVAGEWRNTMAMPNAYTPYLSMSGTAMPVIPGDAWGGGRGVPASATFAVYELETDKDGKLVKFAADFIFSPSGRPDKPVVGVLRVNTKFP